MNQRGGGNLFLLSNFFMNRENYEKVKKENETNKKEEGNIYKIRHV